MEQFRDAATGHGGVHARPGEEKLAGAGAPAAFGVMDDRIPDIVDMGWRESSMSAQTLFRAR
jgi:hypothetical protein